MIKPSTYETIELWYTFPHLIKVPSRKLITQLKHHYNLWFSIIAWTWIFKPSTGSCEWSFCLALKKVLIEFLNITTILNLLSSKHRKAWSKNNLSLKTLALSRLISKTYLTSCIVMQFVLLKVVFILRAHAIVIFIVLCNISA